MNKRDFIKTLGLGALSLPLKTLNANSIMTESNNNSSDKWEDIRQLYDVPKDFINFENGYYNVLPKPILDAQLKYIRMMNERGSHYMRTDLMNDREKHRKSLADFLGVSDEEVIITRNTTESMNTVICGMDWKAGDEVILSKQEYPAMIDMLKQQSSRYLINNQFIDLPLHPESDDEIVDLYRQKITDKTRLILVSHVIFFTGQILPIRKICEMAHQKGVKVLVDGAHAVGHIQFKLSELNCDYYGSSLHKWLCLPLGAGFLYVKKQNIEDLWPLFGEYAYNKNDIRKLNHTGTGPYHVEMCIQEAIDFYNRIGPAEKENRLRDIQQEIIKGLGSNYSLNTPSKHKRSCAIVNIHHKSLAPTELAEKLMKEHKIWTVGIDYAGTKGIRITPNVYNTFEEVKQLTKALNSY